MDGEFELFQHRSKSFLFLWMEARVKELPILPFHSGST